MTEAQAASGSLIVNPEPEVLRRPDINWRRFSPNPSTPPVGFGRGPDGEVHWQEVTVQNTASGQNHVVIDRHYVGHELQPGQQKRLELLVQDIENFMRLARPGRVDMFNRPIQPHPIRILDLDRRQVLRDDRPSGASENGNV